MTKNSDPIANFISTKLHNFLFLEEFVFARNKFSAPVGGELELADAVVLLGDVLIVYQIKERALDHAGDAEREKKWFEEAVLRRATKQIRDTLS